MFFTLPQERWYKKHSDCQMQVIKNPFLMSVNPFVAFFWYTEDIQTTKLSLGMSALTYEHCSAQVLVKSLPQDISKLNIKFRN